MAIRGAAEGGCTGPERTLSAAAGVLLRSTVALLLAGAGVALAPGAVGAQEQSAEGAEQRVRPGDTVQVRAPSLVWERAEGPLRAVRGDTLVVGDGRGGVAVRVHRGDVEELRVRRGAGDARWRGAFLGAPAGLIAGIAVDEETREDHDEVRPALRIGGLVGGAALGWVIGRFIEVDRWVEVEMAVSSGGAGIGLGFSVR